MPEASRPSRIIYRSLASSDRLAGVSDGAWRLFVLLLLYQDDEGRVPWSSPTMVRSIIVGTPWTREQADGYCEELARIGAVVRDDAFLVIRRGKELNGAPKSGDARWRAPRRYAVSEGVSAPLSQSVRRREGELPTPDQDEPAELKPLIAAARRITVHKTRTEEW